MKISKKHKILELFNNLEWHNDCGYDYKRISADDLESIGLNPLIENPSQYCDVHYVRSILQKENYLIAIGGYSILIRKKVCLLCGGRGWYLKNFSDNHRTICERCGGTGKYNERNNRKTKQER